MMSFSILMLLVLLGLALAVAVGGVMLVLRLPSKARWALVLLLGVVGLPLIALLLLRAGVWHGHRAGFARQTHLDVVQEQLAEFQGGGTDTDFPQPDGGSAWWPEAVEALRAQCYPTSREAAQSLARKIAGRLQDSVASGESPLSIRLDGPAVPDPKRDVVVRELAQALRHHLGQAEVTVGTDSQPAGDSPVVIAISMHIGRRPAATATAQAGPVPHHGGRVRGARSKEHVDLIALGRGPDTDWDAQLEGRIDADIRHAGAQAQESVRFLDKPWVDRFDVFVSTHPARHYVLARSWSLASYPQEARDQALLAASRQLATRVHAHTSQMIRGRGPSVETIQDKLLLNLQDSQHVADEFSQALETNSGGCVWRHALLLEFTPADALHSASVAASEVRQVRGRRLSTAAAFVGLMVLTCAVYGFLNVATRGYYREALLCGTVAVVIIGGAVLLLVA